MSQHLGVTVPLLILVSLGLCSLIRDYELSEFSDISWVKLIPLINKEFNSMGPFVIVHGLNFGLILLTVSVPLDSIDYWFGSEIFTTRHMPFELMLLLIAGVYFIIFPLLEVTEYQDIPASKEGLFPSSFWTHFVGSSVVLLLMVTDTYLSTMYVRPVELGLVSGFPLSVIWSVIGVGWIFGSIVTILWYSYKLEKEIQEHVA